jgi:hypothetical protein
MGGALAYANQLAQFAPDEPSLKALIEDLKQRSGNKPNPQ